MVDEDLVARAASATGKRMASVVSAFAVLIPKAWPKPELARQIAVAERIPEPLAACKQLMATLDAVYAAFPTAMFWWKNERSEFLGFCPRFAIASGVVARDLFGRSDADPAVAWCRQAAVYMRDDRDVMLSAAPRFDILERQDRDGDTVWLRTNKVPYKSAAGQGTVGGFDTISVAHAQRIAKQQP
jgi:hypothetical protein